MMINPYSNKGGSETNPIKNGGWTSRVYMHYILSLNQKLQARQKLSILNTTKKAQQNQTSKSPMANSHWSFLLSTFNVWREKGLFRKSSVVVPYLSTIYPTECAWGTTPTKPRTCNNTIVDWICEGYDLSKDCSKLPTFGCGLDVLEKVSEDLHPPQRDMGKWGKCTKQAIEIPVDSHWFFNIPGSLANPKNCFFHTCLYIYIYIYSIHT